jgi:hypothetical protein
VAHTFEITLPCSVVVAGMPIPVTIQLIALKQSLVYAGLLEGVPHEEMNKRFIEGAVRDAKKEFGEAEPFLIQPKQTPLDIGREYPFGKPAIIPGVLCIAFFLCVFPTPRGQGGDYSAMKIVWFQDQFAMPIDSEILDQIRAVDWLGLATRPSSSSLAGSGILWGTLSSCTQ